MDRNRDRTWSTGNDMVAQQTPGSKMAVLLSNIFIPPTWSVLMFWSLSVKFGHSAWTVFLWGTTGTLFTAVIPILYVKWLQKKGAITHKHIPLRSQRHGTYVLSMVLLLLTFDLLYVFKASPFLLAAVLALVGNTLVTFMINLFWKISAHMAGTAGPLIILTFAFGWFIAPFYLFLILIGWSRIFLKAHTPAQVIWGGLVGLFLTYGQMIVYLKWLHV
ncbi:MAG: hypothetical protein GXO76_08420 [Calditrichaeota bacterium]|nr:hypothetical protein [Calditrichota bacterium]